jgi:hypothetical protein
VAAEQAFGSGAGQRVRYEDLVQVPEATPAWCLDFVGEPFHADCLLPLKVEINSSNVPEGYDPADPRTTPPYGKRRKS